MLNLVKVEIGKCIKRKEFALVILLIVIAIASDFTFTCIRFWGSKYSGLLSAYDATIITNIVKTPLYPIFSVLLPLTVSIIYSDSYLEEDINGISNFINTRTSRNKNIISKAIAISIISFSITLIPLLINQVLALIAFPIQGHNGFGLPDYKKLLYIDKGIILHELKNYNPYINNIVFMVIRSIAAVSFALISYGCSFIPKINRYLAILSSLFINVVISTGSFILGNVFANINIHISDAFFTNILYTNAYGNIIVLFGILVLYLIIGVFFIYKGIKQNID